LVNVTSLGFLCRESLLNIRRNGLMSLAALGTVTMALTVLGASLWSAYRLNEYARQQPQMFNQIDVFLPTEASRDEANSLQTKLQTDPAVAVAKLVPKETAWAELQSDTPSLTDSLPDNPLPDKLEVRAKDPAQIGALAVRLRDANQFPEIAKVFDAGAEVREMLAVARLIKLIGGGVAAGLFIATLFIVQNTIRLTVFARRREIRIMQMVGATPNFIRLPLLLEGLFHGVVGAVIAGGIILFFGREVSQAVVSIRSPLVGNLPSGIGPLDVIGGIIAIGAFVGLLGSHLSMRRFLKQI
jgi:cell division transport system permease protein